MYCVISTHFPASMTLAKSWSCSPNMLSYCTQVLLSPLAGMLLDHVLYYIPNLSDCSNVPRDQHPPVKSQSRSASLPPRRPALSALPPLCHIHCLLKTPYLSATVSQQPCMPLLVISTGCWATMDCMGTQLAISAICGRRLTAPCIGGYAAGHISLQQSCTPLLVISTICWATMDCTGVQLAISTVCWRRLTAPHIGRYMAGHICFCQLWSHVSHIHHLCITHQCWVGGQSHYVGCICLHQLWSVSCIGRYSAGCICLCQLWPCVNCIHHLCITHWHWVGGQSLWSCVEAYISTGYMIGHISLNQLWSHIVLPWLQPMFFEKMQLAWEGNLRKCWKYLTR